MAYLPVKARSELVEPTKPSAGGVFETTRRFQVASSASYSPARRPTRGSGDGAATDAAAGAGCPTPEDIGEPHAARASRPAAASSERDAGGGGRVTGCLARG